MKKFGIILAAALFTASALATVYVSDNDKNVMNRTTFRLSAESIVIAEGGTGTNGYGAVKLFDFPEGHIKIHAASLDLDISIPTAQVAAGSGLNVAVGTATAIPTTSTTAHTGTRADLVANVEVDPHTNSTTRFQSTLPADVVFDGTATAKDAYLNLLVDDGDIAATSTGTVNGTVQIIWSLVGDD